MPTRRFVLGAAAALPFSAPAFAGGTGGGSRLSLDVYVDGKRQPAVVKLMPVMSHDPMPVSVVADVIELPATPRVMIMSRDRADDFWNLGKPAISNLPGGPASTVDVELDARNGDASLVLKAPKGWHLAAVDLVGVPSVPDRSEKPSGKTLRISMERDPS